MFNIIHPASGLKIDVIVPTMTSFDQQRFERVVRVPMGDDWAAVFSSPEDIILQKLRWHSMGGGERHLRDIEGILKVRSENLDRAYIGQQALELGVAELWQSVLVGLS
jgi:hypothetical protein